MFVKAISKLEKKYTLQSPSDMVIFIQGRFHKHPFRFNNITFTCVVWDLIFLQTSDIFALKMNQKFYQFCSKPKQKLELCFSHTFCRVVRLKHFLFVQRPFKKLAPFWLINFKILSSNPAISSLILVYPDYIH